MIAGPGGGIGPCRRADLFGIGAILGAGFLAGALPVLPARPRPHEHGGAAEHHATAQQHQCDRARHPHEANVRLAGR